MTNLDVMKQALTTQINNLSAPDFEKVMDTLFGLNDNADKNKLLFNDTHLLSCAKCHKILGECHLNEDSDDNGISECHQRFAEFASRPSASTEKATFTIGQLRSLCDQTCAISICNKATPDLSYETFSQFSQIPNSYDTYELYGIGAADVDLRINGELHCENGLELIIKVLNPIVCAKRVP
jgi:hypothetical protein